MTFEQDYYETPEFWSDGALTNAGTMLRIRETIAMVPADVSSLLDVGCGNGTFVNTLVNARSDIRISATDRSGAALHHVTTQKYQSDISAIPRPDGTYDCVTCLQVIEHLPCELYGRALRELARVSRKYLIVSVPFEEDLSRDITQCPKCLSQFNVNLHLRSYDEQTVRTLFAPDGFKCALVRSIAPATKWYGQDRYVKMSAYVARKRHPRFQSPICPVCGYRNAQYDPGSSNPASDAVMQKPSLLRRTVKAVWPRFAVPGYWIAALYEKSSSPSSATSQVT